MTKFSASQAICKVSIQRKSKHSMFKIILSASAVIFAITGCLTPSKRVELDIGGKKVTYVMQKCNPTIKWDGINLVLEGIQVPNKGDLSFSIGKIDYSEKAIREIKSTVFYYDGLLNATCQTLVRLDGQEAIERYSKHRDILLSNLAQTLSKIEDATSESSALEIAANGKTVATQQDIAFKEK